MNRAIRVFHVLPNLSVGGGEKLAIDICSFLDKDSFNCTIVSLYKSQETIYEQLAKENNIEIIFLDKKKGIDLNVIIQLISIFKKYKPDIIHTHLYVMSYVLPAAIFCNIKNIIHTVHSVANKELRKPVRRIMYIAYKVFSVTPVAISSYIKDTIHKEYRIDNQYIKCIYNGVDTFRFKNKRDIKNKQIIELIHVGKFRKEKNHKLLIESFKLVSEEIDNIQLKLVGDGELRGEIEELVEKLEIKSKVIFRGIQKDIAQELKKSDIFVLSSDWEGIPLSVIEAMAAKLPIISTKAGGVVDIVNNNEVGFLVEIGDKKGLANAIIKLSNDYEMRERFANEAVKQAKKYDIRNKVKEYEELYKESFR